MLKRTFVYILLCCGFFTLVNCGSVRGKLNENHFISQNKTIRSMKNIMFSIKFTFLQFKDCILNVQYL